MNPCELKATIYLGDRAVKQVIVDGWNKRVKIQIDSISRIRSPDGQWHYYTDEDIENGFLVFEGVKSFAITPTGSIPDDYVVDFDVQPTAESENLYRARLCTAGSLSTGERGEVNIELVAGTFHLEDPTGPGEPIVS